MSQQPELRRPSVPTCFKVVPSISPDTAGTADPPRMRGCFRTRLAENEDEAQQNWEALIETRAQLAERREQLEASLTRERHLRNRIRRLRSRFSDQYRVIQGLASHAERVAEADNRAVVALSKAQGPMTDRSRDIPTSRQVRNVKHALDEAHKHFPTLSIPEVVVKDAIAALDQSGRRKSRGRAVMAALTALHTYVLDDAFEGDFKQWCESGGCRGVSYSANRVTMGESTSVQRSGRMMHARRLPVDPALDLSGRRSMTAHIRIDDGPTAPRLYFLDDTPVKTGKIHIGYIGPHLPTANDPK